MKSIVNGINFMLEYIEDPLISYLPCKIQFPYILVCIGSGVSILLVESHDKYKRVGGSIIGGGTLLGLGNLLIKENKFENLHNLAIKGSNVNIDMMVDSAAGKEQSLLSSSFGRISIEKSLDMKDVKSHYKSEDISSSLITMISLNIGHLSALYAKLNNVQKYTDD